MRRRCRCAACSVDSVLVAGMRAELLGFIVAHKDRLSVIITWYGDVQVTYDPREVSYERLLSEFFQRVDPTTRNRQARPKPCRVYAQGFAQP